MFGFDSGSVFDGSAAPTEPEVIESRLLLSIMNTNTHTQPITVGTIICQMMRMENRQDQSEKAKEKNKEGGLFSCQILRAMKDRTGSTAKHQGSIDNRPQGDISYSCVEATEDNLALCHRKIHGDTEAVGVCGLRSLDKGRKVFEFTAPFAFTNPTPPICLQKQQLELQ